MSGSVLGWDTEHSDASYGFPQSFQVNAEVVP